MNRRNQHLSGAQHRDVEVFSHNDACETLARSTRSARSSYCLLSGRSPVRSRPGAPTPARVSAESADRLMWDIPGVVGNPGNPLYREGAAVDPHHVKIVPQRAQRVEHARLSRVNGDIQNTPLHAEKVRIAKHLEVQCSECCEWIPLAKLPTHADVCIGAIPFDKVGVTIDGIVEERR